MNTFLKLPMLGALMLCANTAVAFTPAGDVATTESSSITTTWQPMVAQRGDSIAEACEGFAYNQCVREFVVANRDKFPERFTSESDFFLNRGTAYMVPTQDGLIASAEPKSSTAEAPNLLEIINGLSQEQEQLAAEIAALSTALSLNDSNIETLAAELQTLSSEIPNIGPLRESLGGLEEAFLLLRNGELTEGMLASIQDRIDASLTEVTADISALQQADLEFNGRLTTTEENVGTLQADVTTLQSDVAATSFWSSTQGLALIFGVPLILVAGLLVFTISNRRQVNGTVTRVDAIETRLDAVEAESKTTKVMAVTTRDDLAAHQADIDSMLEVKSTDIESADGNLTPSELAKLQPGQDPVEQLYHCKGNTYAVEFWRDTSTPEGYVDNNLRRRVDSDELLGPISIKKLNGRLAAAISSGRLQPSCNMHSIAAE